jgi:D-alanyl-D-alanine carboxypeptidase (penicillin-binding protein 5/6)
VSADDNGMKIDAKAAVLIDGRSGQVLFAQNEKEHLPPASVTKVMTLLLVLEACDKGEISLQDKVTISETAAGMGGSQMYMESGEQHTVEELVKGVIMVSANDG